MLESIACWAVVLHVGLYSMLDSVVCWTVLHDGEYCMWDNIACWTV